MEKVMNYFTGFFGGLITIMIHIVPVTILWTLLTGELVFNMDVIANSIKQKTIKKKIITIIKSKKNDYYYQVFNSGKKSIKKISYFTIFDLPKIFANKNSFNMKLKLSLNKYFEKMAYLNKSIHLKLLK